MGAVSRPAGEPVASLASWRRRTSTPGVERWVKQHFRCHFTATNKGLQAARLDVIGLRDVGGQLSGDYEMVTVEVKSGSHRFAASAGQTTTGPTSIAATWPTTGLGRSAPTSWTSPPPSVSVSSVSGSGGSMRSRPLLAWSVFRGSDSRCCTRSGSPSAPSADPPSPWVGRVAGKTTSLGPRRGAR